ncbi:19925_t:CDS:2, partial [Gigaspora rosea]
YDVLTTSSSWLTEISVESDSDESYHPSSDNLDVEPLFELGYNNFSGIQYNYDWLTKPGIVKSVLSVNAKKVTFEIPFRLILEEF